MAVILFGSQARGDAGADSDLDVLVVRPAGLGFDDDHWTDALVNWSIEAGRICGRPIEILEAGADELTGLLERPAPSVWHEIAEDGIVLTGRSLSDLAGVVG